LQFDSLAIELYGPYFEINSEKKKKKQNLVRSEATPHKLGGFTRKEPTQWSWWN